MNINLHLLECLDINDESDLVLTSDIDLKGLLSILQRKPNLDGRLFFGANNQNALRFECGDEPDGKVYTKKEIVDVLEKTGVPYRCYSVYPCLEYPQLVYAEGVLPNEELIVRYFPRYNHPEKVFETEEFLIDELVKNGLFHEKANAYLFECGDVQAFSDIRHITFSADRYQEKAFATIIRENGKVEKLALYPEGIQQLHVLDENTKSLQSRGIRMVSGQLTGRKYITSYVHAPLATSFMKSALRRSRKEFINLMDRFMEIILQSSEKLNETEDGVILKRGYLDMVPLNAFYQDDDFLFFDQEFYMENCPAKAIMYRALIIPYCGDEEVWRLCPLEDMLHRYGLAERREYWQHYADKFLESLHDPREWETLNRKYGRNNVIMEGNKRIRQMKQQPNPFNEIGKRQVCVFGTGIYADKFFDMYCHDYQIIAAVDNDPNKQGKVWKNLPVLSPASLRSNKELFVMVCIKDAEPVMKQLEELGLEHYGLYDAHHVYPGRQADDIPYTGKPYHIGYCAGVYDLFHIGHVNIFRRAKEMCDYLIVGVVTDEGVINNKKREPFIPYKERLEMVSACKYVDEAVEIPYIYCRTPDMFEKYHFDVQFSGSDYEHAPDWLAMKQYLNDRGAEMIFFPYTETTSSTRIKQLISKGLLDEA